MRARDIEIDRFLTSLTCRVQLPKLRLLPFEEGQQVKARDGIAL